MSDVVCGFGMEYIWMLAASVTNIVRKKHHTNSHKTKTI